MRRSGPRRPGPLRRAAVLAAACAVLGAAGTAAAATGDIRTVAGGSAVDGEGVPATAATLWMPRRVAFPPGGGFLVVEFGHGNDNPDGRVRRVTAGGVITTVAGSGADLDGPVAPPLGDGGPAVAATLNGPSDIEVLPSGALLIVDEFNHRVRRVDTGGTISTVAGSGQFGCTLYTGTSTAATSARLGWPRSMALGPGEGYLLLDEYYGTVHRITPGPDGAAGTGDDRITTVAGTCANGFSGDGGPATAARLNNPRGVAATSDGGFLVADSLNARVRRVDAAGTITTVAGTGATSGPSGNGGPAGGAVLMTPRDVQEAPDGGYLIAESGRDVIRRVSPAGVISTLAGNGVRGVTGDGGPATAASIHEPHGVNVAPDGDVYISGPGLVAAPPAQNVVRAVESPVAATAPPPPGVASGPRGGEATSDPTPAWAVLGRFGATHEWRIRVQGGALVPGAAGAAGTAGRFTAPALPDGRYALEARQSVPGGATSGWSSVPFTVDTTPPAVTRVTVPAVPDGDGGWYRGEVAVRVECADAGAGLGAGSGCPAGGEVTAEGLTTFAAATVADLAGNTTTVPALEVRRDVTAPPVPAAATPDGAVAGAAQALRWRGVADAVSGLREYRVTLGGLTAVVPADPAAAPGAAVAWTPPVPLPVGDHPWSVAAVDAAGNVSAAAAGRYVVVPAGGTPPTPVAPTPPAGTGGGAAASPPVTRNTRALLPAAGARPGTRRPTLRWPGVASRVVRVEVRALRAAGAVPVLRATVRGRALRLPRALPRGRYVWSVRPVSPAGRVARTPRATSWFTLR